MGSTPKRRSLEKTQQPASQTNDQRVYCFRCGRAYSRRKGYFPVSHSPIYRGVGYLHICNDCIEEMYDFYREKLGGDREAMRRICMKLDLYWNDSIYESVERTAGVNSRVRKYIGQTNIVRYLDKTYDDTLAEEALASESDKPQNPMILMWKDPDDADGEGSDDKRTVEEVVGQEVVDFWGAGYSVDFYEELERRYAGWTSGKTSLDPTEKSLYRQIALLETIIGRDAAAGKAVDKHVNSLNSLLGSMNLKPAQKGNDSDAELEKMPLGVGVKKWEEFRPLPDTPEKLRDRNGLIKNIVTWFCGHSCKMVNLRNSYCRMYEDAMARLRVNRPELDEEDDDTVLNDIFGSGTAGDSV